MTSLVIGRDESCDVVLEDSFVSRRHVRLDLSENGLCRLIDLHSTNGTFIYRGSDYVTVNEAAVKPSDQIRIGHLNYTVDQLVRLARRPIWNDLVEPYRPTQELRLQQSDLAMSQRSTMKSTEDNFLEPRRWRPLITVLFVVSVNLILWSLALYAIFGGL